jgi:Tfp pilus assembly protein PilV
MKKDRRAGESIFEIVLAVGIFALIAAGFGGAYALSIASRRLATDRTRAVFLAEEGLEAVRNMRTSSSTNLVNGTWGLATSSNHWVLSGSQDVTNGFVRQIMITTNDTSTKQVTATVSWRSPGEATTSVSVASYLTNLLYPLAAQCMTVSTSGVGLGNLNTDITGITLGNSCGGTITLDEIKLTWGNGLIFLEGIQINGTTVWTGVGTNQTTFNITNVAIPGGTTAMPINYFSFNSSMSGTTVTAVFIMTDGSSQTVIFTP